LHENGAELASANAQGETLAGLSRFIGRRDGYLHAYVSAGIPQELRKAERALLARYFGIDERELRAALPND
jgi:repressor LexA